MHRCIAPTSASSKTSSLVVFVGGCTQSEVTAMRKMSSSQHTIVVVTTSMLSSHSFIDAYNMQWAEVL